MKRKIYIICMVSFLIIATVITPAAAKLFLPEARLAAIETIGYTEYVYASGEVLSRDQITQTAEFPLIIGKVFVSGGDEIAKGDPIASVNREMTAKAMMELNEYSTIAALGAGTTVTDYESIIALLPDMIYASSAGTVMSVSASDGSAIGAGGTIFTLCGTEPLSVAVSVRENDISKIAQGQKAYIGGSGFGDKVFSGVVDSIAQTATKQYSGAVEQTVVEVFVLMDEYDESVKSGYSADVKIKISEERDIMLLPYEAVESDGRGSFVNVFCNGVAKKKYVITGVELPYGVEIRNGIESGETVIYSESELNEGEYVVLKSDE